MGPITKEELDTILKDFLNSKASSISNIKYEMLKKSDCEAKRTLRKYFSFYLNKGISSLS